MFSLTGFFRYILELFFPRKWSFTPRKSQKCHFQVFVSGLCRWGVKRCSIFAPKWMNAPINSKLQMIHRLLPGQTPPWPWFVPAQGSGEFAPEMSSLTLDDLGLTTCHLSNSLLANCAMLDLSFSANEVDRRRLFPGIWLARGAEKKACQQVKVQPFARQRPSPFFLSLFLSFPL